MIKVKINGMDMEAERLKIVETVEEPWCRYIAVDSAGKRYEVRIRATVTTVLRLPMQNQDGTPACQVGNNVVPIVEEIPDEPSAALTK